MQLPIIFITGHGGVQDRCRRSKGGALDFEKPFPADRLIERIDAAFQIPA